MSLIDCTVFLCTFSSQTKKLRCIACVRFIIVIASVFNTDLYCISVHAQICPPAISVCSFNASTEVGNAGRETDYFSLLHVIYVLQDVYA